MDSRPTNVMMRLRTMWANATAFLAGLTVDEVERRLIFDTLERTRNNRTQAARLLGISIRTLRNKLATYRGQGLIEVPAVAERRA